MFVSVVDFYKMMLGGYHRVLDVMLRDVDGGTVSPLSDIFVQLLGLDHHSGQCVVEFIFQKLS